MSEQKGKETIGAYTIIGLVILLVVAIGVFNFMYESKEQKTYTNASETLKPYDAALSTLEIPKDLYFGIKESEIIKLYGEPYLEHGDVILYELTDNGMGFDRQDLALGITKDGLKMIQYAFGYRFDTDEKPFIEKTEEIKNIIVSRYGDNFSYTENWKNEKYKNDFESWGKAIENQHLEIVHVWELEDLTITLRTTDVGIFLDYTAK